MNENEKYKTDILYKFFTDLICEKKSEIIDNSYKLKQLTKKQTELKRGVSKLVEMRRELGKRSIQ